MKLLAFCEAPADFDVLSTLVEREVRASGPTWVSDVLDADGSGILDWIPALDGRPFWDVHHIYNDAERLDVRRPQGHFADGPGAPSAAAARTMFAIARHVAKTQEVDGVVLVIDLDQQAAERRRGLGQARREAVSLASYAIVIGCPNAEREAWVLAGFDCQTDAERERLATLSKELGFSPIEHAHRLDAIHDHDKKSPKRVLAALTGGDREREALCWTETPLDTLRARTADTGLAEFLDQIKTEFLPRLLTR